MKKDWKRGFTLVELLVVIAIIGILTVVATPALLKNIQKAKISELEADYSAIRSAMLTRYAEYNELERLFGDLEEIKNEIEGLKGTTPLGGQYNIEVDMEYVDTDGNSSNMLNYTGYRLKSNGEFIETGENVVERYKAALALVAKRDPDNNIIDPVKVTESQFKKLANDIGIDRVYYSTNEFNNNKGNYIYIGLIPQ